MQTISEPAPGPGPDEKLLLSTSFCSFKSPELTVFTAVEIVQDIFSEDIITVWVLDPLSTTQAETYEFSTEKAAYKFLIQYILKNKA